METAFMGDSNSDIPFADDADSPSPPPSSQPVDADVTALYQPFRARSKTLESLSATSQPLERKCGSYESLIQRNRWKSFDDVETRSEKLRQATSDIEDAELGLSSRRKAQRKISFREKLESVYSIEKCDHREATDDRPPPRHQSRRRKVCTGMCILAGTLMVLTFIVVWYYYATRDT